MGVSTIQPRGALFSPPHDPAPIWLMMRIAAYGTIAIAAFELVYLSLEFAIWQTENDDLTSLLTVLTPGYTILYVSMYVAWFFGAVALLWLTYRLMRNLHTLAPDGVLMSPTLAIGWYLVPLANLFIPPRVVALIRRGTLRNEAQGGSAIAWWWGAALVTTLAFNITAILEAAAYEPDADISLYEGLLCAAAIAWCGCIAANVLMLRVFGPIARAQSALLAARN